MKLLKDGMRKAVFLFFFNLFCFVSIAQELNCVVTVNSDQLTQGDLQVFKTLERSLNDFINKSKHKSKHNLR